MSHATVARPRTVHMYLPPARAGSALSRSPGLLVAFHAFALLQVRVIHIRHLPCQTGCRRLCVLCRAISVT